MEGPVSFNYTLGGKGAAGTALLHKLEGESIHLDAPQAGTFRSPEQLLNRAQELILAAIASKMQHVLTDCRPRRRRSDWQRPQFSTTTGACSNAPQSRWAGVRTWPGSPRPRRRHAAQFNASSS